MDNKSFAAFMKSESVITSLSVSFLFTFTLFFFGPATLYYTNIFEFAYTFSDIFPLLISLAIVFGLLLSYVLLLFKGKHHHLFVTIVLCLGLLFYIQGNILVWNYGPLNGQEIGWENYFINGVIDSSIWIIVFYIAFLKSEKVYRSAIIISIFLLVVQTGGFLALAHSAAEEPHWKSYSFSGDSAYDFSENKNVIIIVLDTFQSDIFQEIINEDAEYKNAFSGFTYYRNALGGYPSTIPSVPLILTGQYYINSMPYDRFTESAYMSSSLPKKMHESGFVVDIFDDPSLVYPSETMISNTRKNAVNYTDIITSKLPRVTVFRFLPHFLKELWYSQFLEQVVIINEDLSFANSLNNITKKGNNVPMFKFYHFAGAHPPFRLNETLAYEELPDNRSGYIEQSKASLKITGNFLKKLQEMGYYNNSLIIIVGDHGAQNNAYGFNRIQLNREVPISYISNDMVSAGIPLILIKPFNSADSFTISDAPVSLSDIPKTVATELSLSNDFPGMSIRTINESEKRNRTFYYFSSGDEFFATGYLDPFQKYVITNFSWYGDSWQPTYLEYTSKGVIETPPPLYYSGTQIKFGIDQKTTNYLLSGWGKPEESQVVSEGKTATLAFSTNTSDSDLMMKFSLYPAIFEHKQEIQRVIVYANHHEIGNFTYTHYQLFENNVVIPNEFLNDKIIYITFYLPDAISPEDLGLNNDHRNMAIALTSFNITTLNNDKFTYSND